MIQLSYYKTNWFSYLIDNGILKLNQNILLLIISAIFVLLLSIRLYLPHNIELYGKVIPSEELIIQQSQNDVIKVNYNNTLDNSKINKKIFMADRGDVLSLELNHLIKVGSQVTLGDTLCVIRSNETKLLINELTGELLAAKELLKIFLSPEKKTIIKEAEARHAQAISNLNILENIFSRYTELYTDSLISNEDFEYQKIQYEISKSNAEITEAQLESVLTAAKPEQINHQRQIISNLEEQLAVLIDRQNDGFIISPLSGTLSLPTYNDTILIIKNINNPILISPVQFKYYNELKIGQEITIKDNNNDLSCRISYISDDVININGKPVIYIISVIEPSIGLINGQILSGKLNLGKISIIKLLQHIFS